MAKPLKMREKWLKFGVILAILQPKKGFKMIGFSRKKILWIRVFNAYAEKILIKELKAGQTVKNY